MGRKVYVAVGSTAIKGMMSLIGRLMEESIYYQPDNRDLFIGIDSDKSVRDALGRLDTDRKRILPVELALSSDSPEQKFTQLFQDSWNNLSIGPSGVGGDRRRSFAALGWTGFWDQAHLHETNRDDVFILMGSAFGGTSTGLFWNVAEFLKKQISAREDALPETMRTTITFHALLLLPEAPGTLNKDYPISGNLCAFLKDTQVLEWRSRLYNHLEGFKTPAYFAIDSTEKFLPIWNKRVFGYSETSNLPVESLFIVPTSKRGQSDTFETIAEICMTLFHLGLNDNFTKPGNIRSATADRHTKGGEGAANSRAVEDRPFAGLNMVACRNGRNALLRKRFYDMLNSRWKVYSEGSVPDSDTSISSIVKIIEKIKHGEDMRVEEDRNITDLIEFIKLADIKELDRSLASRLDNISDTSLLNVPYCWKKDDDILKQILEILQSKEDNPEKEMITTNLSNLTIYSLCEGYRRAYDETVRISGLVKNRKNDMIDSLRTAKSKSRIRGESAVAKLTGGADAAKVEVRKQLSDYLEKKIQEFIDACRSKATIEKMPSPVDADTKRKRVLERIRQIQDRIEKNMQNNASGHAEFIYEGSSDKADLSKLNESRLSFSLNEVILEAVNSPDEASIDEVIKKYEISAVRDLREAAKSFGANNPLNNIITVIPVGTLKPFSSVFALSDSNKYHWHFCIESGNVERITWGDVKNTMGLKSFDTFSGSNKENEKFDPSKKMSPQDSNSWKYSKDQPGIGEAQGVWLGTLGVDFSIRDIISKAYAGCPLPEWQNEVTRKEDSAGGEKPRLLSLRQMVYLGCVLRALEVSTIKALEGKYDYAKLDIILKTPDGSILLNEKQIKTKDAGFEMYSNTVYLDKIPVKWLGIIMKWIRNQGEGFENAFKLNKPDALGGLLSFENRILTDIDMRIPDNIFVKIEKLAQDLCDCFDVKVS